VRRALASLPSIAGGTSLGTIFGLFLVPVVYLLLSGKHEGVEVSNPETGEGLTPAESDAYS
jgi:hypothetical protein